MALSSVSSSVSIGSDEHSEVQQQVCDICKPDYSVEAVGFCTDCWDYLCEDCFKSHCKTKLTKDHKLLGKDLMPSKIISNKIKDVNCSVCGGLLAQSTFYCEGHALLLCANCVFNNHKSCRISSSNETKTSDEISKYMSELISLQNEYAKQIKLAEENAKTIEKTHNDTITSIDLSIELLKIKLDELQTIRNKVEAHSKKNCERIKRIKKINIEALGEVRDVMEDIDTLKGKNQPLSFISMTESKPRIRSAKEKTMKENGDNVVSNLEFKPNLLLHNMLKNTVSSGLLRISFEDVMTTAFPSDGTYVEYGYPRSIALKKGCSVLIDKLENKVQAITGKDVITHTLSSFPWDIARIDDATVAVTLPREEKVAVLRIQERKIETEKLISVHCQCEGIAHADGRLFLASTKPAGIIIYDTSGRKINEILRNMDEQPYFEQPAYIDVSKDLGLICVSDRKANKVFVMNLDGNNIKSYTNENMQVPLSIAFLDKSVFVFGCKSMTIHIILCKDAVSKMQTRFLHNLSAQEVFSDKKFDSNAFWQSLGGMLLLFVSKDC